MRKIVLAAIMAVSLAVTGCSFEGGTEGETPADQLTNAIVTTCSFKPDISSISAILAALGPEVSLTAALVDQIANSVCASVGPAPDGTFAATDEPKKAVVVVDGKQVEVVGKWLKLEK